MLTKGAAGPPGPRPRRRRCPHAPPHGRRRRRPALPAPLVQHPWPYLRIRGRGHHPGPCPGLGGPHRRPGPGL